MNIKTVIFDLDGTLIDSLGDIITAVNKTLQHFNLPILSEEVIGSYVGQGVELLVKRSVGQEDINNFDEILKFYMDTYNKECAFSTILFPGVNEVLEELKEKQIKIALATNKSIGFSEKILYNLGIHKYFDIIMGPENVQNRKPHREVIDTIVEKLNGNLDTTMIVGDSMFDVLCGKNAGIYTCGVTYGIGSVQSLIDSKVDFLICDIEKLLLLLK